MSSESKPIIRCAIYTRKSSEEGLEQSFNSLDAQREACHAFITSQRQEGWRALPSRYDDGGYSGGTLERPALQQLLKDIENGKVDTIVVYKVDRLTRSLADFAKIVEALDARGVSFVSVTQQFNTTSSMGRLTLNVLLSFAQFEREVTGERIRDKIAASKRKGMWMGGRVAVGYDVKERKLTVNPQEAKLVRRLFELYLQLGCVSKLKTQLDREAIKSKQRTSAAGNCSGGTPYSRGALYRILQNRIYIAEIRHRSQHYVGEHDAIIPRELWEEVQTQLKSDNQGRRNGLKGNSPSVLVGLLQDAEGNRFTPSHTLRNGRRYRYYVCQGKIDAHGARGKSSRIPAHDIETQVSLRLQSFLQSTGQVIDRISEPDDDPALIRKLMVAAGKQLERLHPGSPSAVEDFARKVVSRVVIQLDQIEVEVGKRELRAVLSGNAPVAPVSSTPDNIISLKFKVRIQRCGGEMRLIIPPDLPGHLPTAPTPSLLKAVARGRQWYEWVLAGEVWGRRSIAQRTDFDERHVAQILECAFLAPDIVTAILDGRQPTNLTSRRLTRHLPLSWIEQRMQLGFPPVPLAKRRFI
jgi:DNA invertase Pin-like site-specific DNA recombinase